MYLGTFKGYHFDHFHLWQEKLNSIEDPKEATQLSYERRQVKRKLLKIRGLKMGTRKDGDAAIDQMMRNDIGEPFEADPDTTEIYLNSQERFALRRPYICRQFTYKELE